MFGKEFYPTPKRVIKKMLGPYLIKRRHYRDQWDEEIYQIEDKIILEPSAGKGDILDFIVDEIGYCKDNLHAIEINEELQHILRDKMYNVIHDDFLTFDDIIFFDLILMNPPFSEGEKHLLHAWEILQAGDIVCLLNEETIKNPHTKARKRLKHIIEEWGDIEYLGAVFDTAERKTGVNVALVRLTKEATDNIFEFDQNFSTREDVPDFNESTLKNQVATSDVIDTLLIQYNNAKKSYVEFIKAYNKLKFYTDPLLGEYTNLFDIVKSSLEHKTSAKCYNNYNSVLKSLGWDKVLKSNMLQKFMTSNVLKNFSEFKSHQSNMSLTKEYIFKVINLLFENRHNILDQAIVDVFEIFTSHYKENRNSEGWKTNDSYKVNRKIIFPYWVKYGDYSNAQWLKDYGSDFSTHYREDYNDIDKALCYITGNDINSTVTIKDALEHQFRSIGTIKTGEKFINTCQSKFFDIKFWKKGTLHITFRDEKLWETFNLMAAKGKNWLPDGEEVKNPYKPEAEYAQEVLQLN